MNLQPATLLVGSLGGYVVGGVLGLLFIRREAWATVCSFGVAALSGLSGVLAALWYLTGGAGVPPLQMQLLPPLIPYINFTARLDPLGALFLLIVSLLSFALSTFS